MDKQKRPPLLSALCLLSFLGSGLGFLGYFFASIFFQHTINLINRYSFYNNTDPTTPLYFTFFMILHCTSLIGAIRMWKLHRDGFYYYTISQLTILFIPCIYNNWDSFSFVNTIFTAVFITGYLFNYKKLS